MLRQTQKKDLQLFIDISGTELPEVASNEELVQVLGLDVLVPSFLTSELKRAFTIGFLLFLPFLIIDIVVSSTLMSMGMVMLPPTTISSLQDTSVCTCGRLEPSLWNVGFRISVVTRKRRGGFAVTQDQVLTIMKEALLVALKLSLPLLIASMIIGLIIAIFQAATQIHEQTLTFVPKVIVIGLILLFLGSWMTSVLIDFMSYLFDIMKNFEGVL